jgi:hypothetical protein
LATVVPGSRTGIGTARITTGGKYTSTGTTSTVTSCSSTSTTLLLLVVAVLVPNFVSFARRLRIYFTVSFDFSKLWYALEKKKTEDEIFISIADCLFCC